MDIIFVRTRYQYDSYTDYWKLVELSGFPTCFTDEIDINKENALYIVSPVNGEISDFAGDRKLVDISKAKIAMWNLERPGGSGSLVKFAEDNVHMTEKYFHRIILSDKALFKACKTLTGADAFAYTVLGIHEDLGQPGSYLGKVYDLIHLSCYSNYRSELFDAPDRPKSKYHGFTVATNGWGTARHMNLQLARCMLSIHQDGYPVIEPLRYVLAAAYGLLTFSDYSMDPFPYEPLNVQDLPRFIKNYDREMYERGIALRNYMLENYTFRDCVEAVSEVI